MATDKLRGTAERDVADLRRIPDDLSIPEFLKRAKGGEAPAPSNREEDRPT